MGNDDLERCIDTDYYDYSVARKYCPQNYHIEFTRSGRVLYVLNGYLYDYRDDICYKEQE